MSMPDKNLIIIAGPTAAGKSALAIRLAQHFNTSIISADSRQCYREMTIGTAKPSEEELKAVPHYFINSHSITQHLNVGDYEQLALGYCAEIFKDNQAAIVCGGTGLYIQALCEGIDAMPPVDKAIQMQSEQSFRENGIEWLQAALQKDDPEFFATAEQQNPARLLRALIFYRSHLRSILHYRTGQKKQRDFNIIKIALELPREILYQRINERVDIMMAEGLLNEVKSLLPYRALKNLQTVGYQELFDYLDDTTNLQTAVGLIKQHTRNYAKRQITWFRKDKTYQWFRPGAYDAILKTIEGQLQKP